MNTDENITAQILTHGFCPMSQCGGKGIAEPDHACPFAEELHGDVTPCNCCNVCAFQCAMDI